MNKRSVQAIPPVEPDGGPRPQWSVMIPTYNCADYLRHTLESVLAQDPGPDQMQIEVVDDASDCDDPAAVVAEVGQGRVAFFRQQQNVGHVRNFDTCLQRARGHLVHLLHGDDFVLPGFYRKMGAAFEQAPEIGAAFCRHWFVDEQGERVVESALEQTYSGILDDWLQRIATGPRLQTPSIVVRRDVYERHGGFDRRLRFYGEDWEMWARIALYYPFWYETEALAAYRSHSSSLTGHAMKTGKNMEDLRLALETILARIPAETATRLSRVASLNLAGFGLKKALWLMHVGEMNAAAIQVREALKSGVSVRVGAATALASGLWVCKQIGAPLRIGPGSIPHRALRKVLG